tara:strand:+ start:310 stop:837 length:528 start_codon:yes stop_codon:yes gene_type:complete
MIYHFKMTEEHNFKYICGLTTRVLGFPDGSLSTKSRKRPLQAARAVASYIARTEEDIHRAIIGKVLNRDRSLIYHYEKTHKKYFSTCLVYRNIFEKVYKAYLDIDGTKEIFTDKDFMKSYLLKNGVSEKLENDLLIEINSGKTSCIIKTNYFDFSNQLENIKLALKNYHYSVKII